MHEPPLKPSALTVTLITGAGSGIGAACARRLARPGAALLLHTRSKEKQLAEVAQYCRDLGAKVELQLSDLAVGGEAKKLVQRTLSLFGQLDHIVSNAGYANRAAIGVASRADFDAAMHSMPGALYEILAAANDALVASPKGAVVAISSFVAHRFREGANFPSTAAAKAAIEALAKAAAIQWASKGVTVNCVAPGYTRKDNTGSSALNADAWVKAAQDTPLGRIAVPNDIAQMVAFLLSEHARYITGQVIHIDGGLTLG
jgi:3-oxoacyl-[acyl-carrier protein] reductase